MSFHEYQVSKHLMIDDPPFYALVMSAMRIADSTNIEKLKAAWPEVWNELKQRYHAPGGVVPRLDGFTVEEAVERGLIES